jgi:hypothetical protein
MVLVLIGETFNDGAPTDLRYVVMASYPADQELSRLTAAVRGTIPMGEVGETAGVLLSIVDAQLVTSPALPPEMAYGVLDLQIVTGTQEVIFPLLPGSWSRPAATGNVSLAVIPKRQS